MADVANENIFGNAQFIPGPPDAKGKIEIVRPQRQRFIEIPNFFKGLPSDQSKAADDKFRGFGPMAVALIKPAVGGVEVGGET